MEALLRVYFCPPYLFLVLFIFRFFPFPCVYLVSFFRLFFFFFLVPDHMHTMRALFRSCSSSYSCYYYYYCCHHPCRSFMHGTSVCTSFVFRFPIAFNCCQSLCFLSLPLLLLLLLFVVIVIVFFFFLFSKPVV